MLTIEAPLKPSIQVLKITIAMVGHFSLIHQQDPFRQIGYTIVTSYN